MIGTQKSQWILCKKNNISGQEKNNCLYTHIYIHILLNSDVFIYIYIITKNPKQNNNLHKVFSRNHLGLCRWSFEKLHQDREFLLWGRRWGQCHWTPLTSGVGEKHILPQWLPGWWFQPLWNIWKSMGRVIPYIVENKKCLKPPTSYRAWTLVNHWIHHKFIKSVYDCWLQKGLPPSGCFSCLLQDVFSVMNHHNLPIWSLLFHHSSRILARLQIIIPSP